MSAFISKFAPFLASYIRHIHTQIPKPQFLIAQNNLPDNFHILLQQNCSIEQTKKVHTQIIVSGLSQTEFLAAKLIANYSHLGFIIDAQNVFETSQVGCFSNLLLWNSIIRVYATHRDYEKAIRVYLRLKNLGVHPDGYTLPLVIRASSSLGSFKLCRIVHSHILQMGLQNNVHIVNELLGMYAKFGFIEVAYELFDRMPVRNYISWNTLISVFSGNYDCDGAVKVFMRMELEGWEPNIVTWTALLSSYARCGFYEETLKWFVLMRERGLGANAEALAVVLSACADAARIHEGRLVHGYVIKGGFKDCLIVRNSLICLYGKNGDMESARDLFLDEKSKNLVTWNSLITSYAESGLCDEALEIFSQLEQSDECTMLRPNLITWSAIIGGFASQGRGQEALELFRRMQIANVKPNQITISSVLSACAELAVLPLGREIHAYVIRSLMDRSILVGNGLVNMYTKCGNLEHGHLVFKKIDGRDLISWNSIIVGYGIHAYGEYALGLFGKMLKDGMNPDEVTFVALLSACAHSGLVSEGRKILQKMNNEFGIEPQIEHYACVVDLLSRAGLLQEAKEIVTQMPMKPNDYVWGALLNASRFHKNSEIAEEAASHFDTSNSESAGTYMLLSNIYAAGGRWDDSARVRLAAKTTGLVKIPGKTWIEVQKKVYTFSAGHAPVKLDELYAILQELGQKMEIEGYVADTSFVLQNVDEAEKKILLNGHSEKLAIAFGHANIPSDVPIRIMKNLRVCGDCHNWTKYFSKITGRKVIVRDARRFHHFSGGSCSCKDYW